MNRLPKTLNKHNGNICFAGQTNSGFVIFECDRVNQTLTESDSPKLITDVSHAGKNAYLTVFGDNFIGLFQNGTFNPYYINTVTLRMDRLASRRDVVHYALNRNSSIIYRFQLNPFIINWQLGIDSTSPSSGEIIVRESDDALIFYDNEQILLIGDLGTEGVIVNGMEIGNGAGLFVEATDEFNPDYTFLRWRQASGEKILWSSSSSSSSIGYSSSSSSSSETNCQECGWNETLLSGNQNNLDKITNLCIYGSTSKNTECEMYVSVLDVSSPFASNFSVEVYNDISKTQLLAWNGTIGVQEEDYPYTLNLVDGGGTGITGTITVSSPLLGDVFYMIN
jgi:hypothetical protein